MFIIFLGANFTIVLGVGVENVGISSTSIEHFQMIPSDNIYTTTQKWKIIFQKLRFFLFNSVYIFSSHAKL